ncbi:MAG: nitrous oxide-stimulated promoter family protein [Candidatus Bathyarchaeia archaeon]
MCDKYSELEAYAKNRLSNCRYQEKKPVCGRCGLKCYNPQYKGYAEKVFTFAGPRMMLEYPLLGFRHFLDSLKNSGH